MIRLGAELGYFAPGLATRRVLEATEISKVLDGFTKTI